MPSHLLPTCRNCAQSAEELPVTASRTGPGGRARAAARLTWGRSGQAGPEARVRVEGSAANRED